MSRAWPDELGRDVLHAALDAPDRAMSAWERARPRLDLTPRVTSPQQRLFPAVWKNLAGEHPDHPDMDVLCLFYRSTLLANSRRLKQAAGWIELLHSGGVDTCVLKGVPLALRDYQDLGARPMADVDMLVPIDQVDTAFELLRSSGWEGFGERSAAEQISQKHAAQLWHPDGGALDLHWFVSGLLVSRRLTEASTAPLLERSEPLRFADVDTTTLCRTDTLVHVAVHGAWRTSGAMVRWVADAATVARAADAADGIDPNRILWFAEEFRLSQMLHETMRYLTDEFDVPVPSEVVSELGRRRPTIRDGLRYRAVTNSGNAPDMFDGVPEWRARWAYARWGRTDREALRMLPRFLVGIWELRSISALPQVLIARGWARVTGRRRPAR